jgi:Phosphotransferase enzyme family
MAHYVKHRAPAVLGSIPDALGMFTAEVRFYREIAPVIGAAGVRVPACYRAEDGGDGTLLELEDLSAWRAGADPAAAAAVLGTMHRRWAGTAPARWPWLRPIGAAVDLVERLYARTWPRLAERGDLPADLAAFGAKVSVTAAEYAIGDAGPLTLVHGDAQARNMRTGPGGEVALLDWEDVSAAPGALDLGWLLTASTDPARWDEVIAAYGGPEDGAGRGTGTDAMAGPLAHVLPAVMVQGLLSMTDEAPGSPGASAWISRLTEALGRLH